MLFLALYLSFSLSTGEKTIPPVTALDAQRFEGGRPKLYE